MDEEVQMEMEEKEVKEEKPERRSVLGSNLFKTDQLDRVLSESLL